MERDSIQNIGNLQIGDRFCFPGDRKKGIVCELTIKEGWWMYYKKGDWIVHAGSDKKLIFLR
jgi:hypothetical protein